MQWQLFVSALYRGCSEKNAEILQKRLIKTIYTLMSEKVQIRSRQMTCENT